MERDIKAEFDLVYILWDYIPLFPVWDHTYDGDGDISYISNFKTYGYFILLQTKLQMLKMITHKELILWTAGEVDVVPLKNSFRNQNRL